MIDSIRSVMNQTHPPDSLIIVDDNSTDHTRDVVREFLQRSGFRLARRYSSLSTTSEGTRLARGIEIFQSAENPLRILYVRNLTNVGKSENLNWASKYLSTSEYFVNVDADTSIDPDYVRRVIELMERDPLIAAGFGCPIPKGVCKSLGGRLVEATKTVAYRIHHFLFKVAQDRMGFVYNLMGCALVYRTEALRRVPRPNDTYAGDTSHAWELQAAGYRVRVAHDAFAHTREPCSIRGFLRQRIRWASGPFQNLYLRGVRTLRRVKGRRRLSALWNMFYYTVLSTKYAILVLSIPLLLLLNLITVDLFSRIILLDFTLYGAAFSLSSTLFHKVRGSRPSLRGDVIPFIAFYVLMRFVWFTITLVALVETLADIISGRAREKWKGLH